MNRYMTFYKSNTPNKIECITENDDYKKAIAEAEEWVWQYAESPEQAIAQHEQKHDEWSNDMDEGRQIKDTY